MSNWFQLPFLNAKLKRSKASFADPLIGPMSSSPRSIPVCRSFFLQQHHAARLGETGDGNLKELLVPYPADQMRVWEISPRVNSPKNDDPSLWEPVHAEPTQTDALELLPE